MYYLLESLLTLFNVEFCPSLLHLEFTEIGKDGRHIEGFKESTLVEPYPLESIYHLLLADRIFFINNFHELGNVVKLMTEIEVFRLVLAYHFLYFAISLDEVSNTPSLPPCEHSSEDVGDVKVQLVPTAHHTVRASADGIVEELISHLVLGEVACLVLVESILTRKDTHKGWIAMHVKVKLGGAGNEVAQLVEGEVAPLVDACLRIL